MAFIHVRPARPVPFAGFILHTMNTNHDAREPLRPAAAHPAERACGLLLGDGARPHKADAVEVSPDATLEELLVAVVSGCLRQIGDNEDAAVLGVDPEGVHQLRVGVRRLRSAAL